MFKIDKIYDRDCEDRFITGFLLGRRMRKKGESISGEEDEWQYPPDWIQIPKIAEENTGYFVISLGTNTTSSERYVYIETSPSKSLPSYIHVEWGDGTTEDILDSTTHTYVHGNGHITNSGAEQFLLKVTCDPHPVDEGDRKETGNVYAFHFGTAENVGFVKAASFHSGAVQEVGHDIYALQGCSGLNYLAMSGDVNKLFSTRIMMNDLYSLKKLDISSSTKITRINSYDLNYCFNLDDKQLNPLLTDVTEVGSNAFWGMYSLRNLNFPKLEKIESSCFGNMYALWSFNAPLLADLYGGGCFQNAYSLYSFNVSDNFDFHTAQQYGWFINNQIL